MENEDEVRTADQEQQGRADQADQAGQELDDELLIEEISIDGMCGVY